MENQKQEIQLATKSKARYGQLLISPEKFYQAIQISTIKDAIYSETPNIFKLSLVSTPKVKALLNIMIAEVIDFLNVGKSMDGTQLLQTVDLILTDPETKNLKPEDFKICFDNAKKGHYGKQYDRVDGQVIFEWLRAYTSERMSIHESLAMLQHNLRAEDEKKQPVNPEGQKKVVSALKEVLKSVNVETKKPEKKRPEPTERDKFIQACYLEFDKLFKNGGELKRGLRFIKWGEKMVGETTYVEIRLTEFDSLISNNREIEI